MLKTNNSILSDFADEFATFKAKNGGLIADLEAVVQDCLDEVGDLLDDCAADLKSSLGADAANGAGDDETAQECAIAAAEAWVTDNVSNGSLSDRIAGVLWVQGCEKGESALREHLPASQTASLRLTLDVTYVLNGMSSSEMIDRLQRMCNRAIGEGMLTGETTAEVEEHSMDVVLRPDLPSEDDLAEYMLQRIESGDLSLEDIPIRLARYGLMDPIAFAQEMDERMQG